MSTAETHPDVRFEPVEERLHNVLASGARPPRPSIVSQALTFGWRGMRKIVHVPEQLMDVTLTPVLFLLMFTYLFGGAVAGSTGEYLQFLLPGMLVQSVLFTAVYSGVVLNTDMTKGVVDRFKSLPIWRPAPLMGALLGDSVRYAVASVVVLVLGVILVLGMPEHGFGRNLKVRMARLWKNSRRQQCGRNAGQRGSRFQAKQPGGQDCGTLWTTYSALVITEFVR